MLLRPAQRLTGEIGRSPWLGRADVLPFRFRCASLVRCQETQAHRGPLLRRRVAVKPAPGSNIVCFGEVRRRVVGRPEQGNKRRYPQDYEERGESRLLRVASGEEG